MARTMVTDISINTTDELVSKDTLASEPKSDAPEFEFNEQTNYVPVKTIITVRQKIQGLTMQS